MEDIACYCDLVEGHSDLPLMFGDGPQGVKHEWYIIGLISLEEKICAYLKYWPSKISKSSCDLENEVKVKWLVGD